MTSCLTSRSMASIRATSASSKAMTPPFSQIVRAASPGSRQSGHGVSACASISNQIRKRVDGCQRPSFLPGITGDHGRLQMGVRRGAANAKNTRKATVKTTRPGRAPDSRGHAA